MRERPDMKFTEITQVIIFMLGPVPIGDWREVDWNPDLAVHWIEHVMSKDFHKAFSQASNYKGLDISSYVVRCPGYEGTYFN